VLTLDLPPALMVPLGPAVYPRVVLGITALLSVILLVNDVLAQRRSAAATPSAGEAAPAAVVRANYPLVLATFVAFGLYVLLLPKLGFLIATFLFVAALQAVLEWPSSWKRRALLVAIALATAIACHLVFETYLQVLLPRGDWSGM
jgi:hypothetical protein